MEGKLQAVLEWLGERQGRKALASAILRALPGEEDHWEQDVQNALNKVQKRRFILDMRCEGTNLQITDADFDLAKEIIT